MIRKRPPRWLKRMNKVVVAMQRLGVPTGPSQISAGAWVGR